jgi:hypothetical protein
MTARVEITLSAPTPAQVAAWARLWSILLAEPTNTKAPLAPTSEASQRVHHALSEGCVTA